MKKFSFCLPRPRHCRDPFLLYSSPHRIPSRFFKIEWNHGKPRFGNPDSIPLDISISDDVEQEILEYLHQCTMRRKPFSDKRHFSLSRVAIYFSIGDSQNESLYCTLGTSDINRCSRGYDSTWYSIASPSPETILSDLRRILSNQ